MPAKKKEKKAQPKSYYIMINTVPGENRELITIWKNGKRMGVTETCDCVEVNCPSAGISAIQMAADYIEVTEECS